MNKRSRSYEEMVKEGIIAPEGGKAIPLIDTRYNTPKEPPKATDEEIDKAIEETEIYREAKLEILKHQRGQIAYGLDKYPETLNANTWDILETIDHIIGEDIDKLHYLVMLKIKLKQMLVMDDIDERENKDGDDKITATPIDASGSIVGDALYIEPESKEIEKLVNKYLDKWFEEKESNKPVSTKGLDFDEEMEKIRQVDLPQMSHIEQLQKHVMATGVTMEDAARNMAESVYNTINTLQKNNIRER